VIEPINIAFELACDAQHAFGVWTERASAWWPRAHTVSREHTLDIVFEPRIGGRVFERTRNGSEHEWGQITVWDPPHWLGYRWHIATDPANATEVEIRFLQLGPGATRVEVQHAGWDRLGPDQGRAWRNVNQGGWDGVLPDYVAACAAGASIKRLGSTRR
jgi:hypothetical protein